MNVKDSVAIISGGASGLGEATIRKIVTNGGRAAIFDLDEKRGLALVEELGKNACFFKTDVTDSASVQAALDGTVECFGGIHIAVNCAGVGMPMKIVSKKGPMQIEKFNFVVQVNLIGTMNVMRLVAEKMMNNSGNEDGEKGVVINTASVAAFDGQVGQVAYAASKAAIVGLTLPAAREFADYGIRVMTIAPGLFETPMLTGLPEAAKVSLTQMMPFPKRLGYPEEYALLAQQIVENPMLNGETIRLDAALRMAAK